MTILLLTMAQAMAANFFVNDPINDTLDIAPGDGFCQDANGVCTIRAAVEEANALAGLDVVYLKYPAPAQHPGCRRERQPDRRPRHPRGPVDPGTGVQSHH